MIYDLTPPISDRLQVWPGDVPPRRQVQCDLQRGDNITLSSLEATVHLGAHADAPSHYGVDAPAIDVRSLDYYLGPCQVMHVAASRRTRLRPDDLPRSGNPAHRRFVRGALQPRNPSEGRPRFQLRYPPRHLPRGTANVQGNRPPSHVSACGS